MSHQHHGADADDVRHHIGVGVTAIERGWGDALDDAAVALAQQCSTAAGARAVVAELDAQLDQYLTRAWEHGWQPADVHRMAVRRVAPAEQQLTLDLVVRHLDGFASATVDPAWHDQVTALDGRWWWSRSQPLLLARRERGTDWLTLLTSTLTVLHLLMVLPPIERLTAVPGAYVPDTGAADDEQRPQVDARVLQRVRRLLAQAESTPYEPEAETFTAAAQSLMARHSIDAALLAESGESDRRRGGPVGRRIGVDQPYDAQKALLLAAVAEANRCRMVWSQHLGFGTVVGFAPDLDAVEMLYASLLVQANRAMTAAGRRTDQRGRSRTRGFRSSFLSAYATRIGERLQDAAQAQVAAVEAESEMRADAGSGTSLVRVLEHRHEEVTEAIEELFPVVQRKGPRRPKDAEGWYSGLSAADRARLGGEGQALDARG